MLRFSMLLVSLGALAAGPVAAGSGPGPGRERVTATISYRAFDLADSAGQRAFDRLIRTTVRQMCADRGASPLQARLREIRCEREAMASARPQRDFAIAAAMRRERLAGSSFALGTHR